MSASRRGVIANKTPLLHVVLIVSFRFVAENLSFITMKEDIMKMEGGPKILIAAPSLGMFLCFDPRWKLRGFDIVSIVNTRNYVHFVVGLWVSCRLCRESSLKPAQPTKNPAEYLFV
jgi:hypothetical protein